MTDHASDPIPGSESMPADLLDAVLAYEAALLIDDLDALDDAFVPGPQTLRGDEAGLLAGHDTIAAFRTLRGGVASRELVRIEHRALGDDAALVVSVSRFAAGGDGLQTQLWTRDEDRWRIAAAHVNSRPRALDRSIWRLVGDPLVPGAADGPLAGRGVAVKDLFAIAGQRIGAGTPQVLAEAAVASESARAVDDLLAAGASLRGVARTDEFAYSIAGDNPHYGTPPNAARPGALPGGSSNGPAAAVALGQADIGLATDTAGSIRVPASYQGLWGLRTTHDRVPRTGLLALAPSFDTVGWLTRDGELLEAVAAVGLPPDPREPDALPARLLVPREVLAACEDATRSAFDQVVARLPASVEPVDLGDLAAHQDAFRIVQAAEAWRQHGDWVERHPGALGPAVAARFATASRVTSAEEAAARDRLAAMRERLLGLLDGAVLVLPTVPGPAPLRIADAAETERVRTATLRLTTPAAIAGAPAVSAPLLDVPIGAGGGTAPVGLCLVSAPGTDLALVRRARQMAAASDRS